MRSLGSFVLRDREKPAGVSSARRLFRLFVVSTLGALGCDVGAAAFADETGPPVHVVATLPEADARDVPLGQSIRIQFDRFLSPLSVLRQSICISSVGPATLASGRQRCEQFPAPRYDPVDRVAIFEPSRPLEAGVRYSVQIFRPSEDTADGIRAFDGAPLDETYVFFFTTERSAPCEVDRDCGASSTCRCEEPSCARRRCRIGADEPHRTIDYCYEPPSLCASDACEAPSLMPKTTPGPKQLLACAGTPNGCAPGSLLDLDDDGLRQLLGQVAQVTATLPDPSSPSRSFAPFGANMPYIDPGFPANSYLLWELILAAHERGEEAPVYPHDGHRCEALSALTDACGADRGLLPPLVRAGDPLEGAISPSMPAGLARPAVDGEYERLRRTLRQGGLSFSEDATLSQAALRTISAWIAEGAPIRDCAPSSSVM